MGQRIAIIDGIEERIFFIRGHKVMLSSHLANLYGVQPKVLMQAVKRNLERFPSDFMFQLNRQEFKNLKSQIVTSSWGGVRRATPYAFTEQGIAMLSSVLNSPQAIQVNIVIMRAFVKMRQILAAHKKLADQLAKLEQRMDKKDQEIMALFEAIRRLMKEEAKPKTPIGFHVR